MSTIDERVVKMEFDNTGFSEGVAKTTQDLDKLDKALKLDGAAAGLDELRGSISNFEMDSVTESVDKVGGRFSLLQEIAVGALRRIGEQAVDLGEDLIKKATIQPLIDGFGEYEDKMRTIKTIQANTGEGLSVISDKLDELNRYADQTVYKFSDMTRNVGMFTTAGVSLSDATNAIKGFSNAAALVNADSAATSRAMVQLSQAMSSGYMRLEDWRSLEMANIAGDKFVEAFKATARAHGIAIDQMIEDEGAFRYTLKDNWLDADLMVEALTNLTYGEKALAEAGLTRDEVYQQLIANGYTEEAANQILDLAAAAEDSAVEIRSWSQLWDTVGESLGSGWAESWEYIVGNMEESTDLFSFFGKKITDTIDAISRSRNDMLKVWHDSGGYQALVGIISNLFEGVWRLISPITDAFSRVFSIVGEDLAITTENFAMFTEKLVISEEQADRIGEVFEGVFTLIHDGIWAVMQLFAQVNVDSVLNIFGNIFNVALDVIDIIQTIGQAVIDALEAIGLFDAVGFVIASLVDGISFLSDGLRGLVGFVKDAIMPWYDGMKKVFDVINDIRIALIETILESEGFNQFSEWISTVADAIGSFISSAAQGPLGAIGDFFTNLFDTISKIGGDDRVAYFKKVFSDLGENLIPILSGLGEAFGNAVGAVTDFISNNEGIKEFFDTVINGAGDFVKGIPEFGKNFYDEAKKFVEGSDLIKTAQNKINVNTLADVGNTLKTKVGGAIEYLATLKPKKLADDMTALLSGDKFSKFKAGLSDFSPSLGSGFEKVCDGFLTTVHNLTDGTENFGDVLANIGANIKNALSNLPDTIRTIFSGISVAVDEGSNVIIEVLLAVKDGLGEVFLTLFNKLPPISEVVKGVKDFLKNVRDSILEEIKKALGFDQNDTQVELPELSLGSITSSFEAPEIGFSLGDFLGGIGEQVSYGIDSFPTDKVEDFGKKIGGWIKNGGEALFGISLIRFFNSLTKLNKSGASIGQGLGTMFEMFPTAISEGLKNFGTNLFKPFVDASKNISDGLKNFGSGLTAWKKETKAEAILKIAAAIGVLVAALWGMSKIVEGGHLEESAQALLKLSVAMSALILLTAGIAKLAKLDLNGVGIGLAGMGVGMLAAVAAFMLFAKIPDDVINTKGFNFIGLILALAAALAIAGRGSAGVGAAALGFVLAITLLLIPINLLASMKDETLLKGGVAVGLLSFILAGAMALATGFAHGGVEFLGLAAAAVAFALAVTELMIPIYLLGNMKDEVFDQGLLGVAVLSILLSVALALATLCGTSLSEWLSMSVAAIAFAAAVTAMSIPIALLSTPLFNKDKIEKATVAVVTIEGLLMIFLVAAGLVNAGIGTYLALSLAAVAFAAAVTAMSVPIILLASPLFNSKKIDSALNAVALMAGIMAVFLIVAGMIDESVSTFLSLSVAMVAFGAAVMLMSIPIETLAQIPGPKLQAAKTTVALMAGLMAIFVVLAGAISEATDNFLAFGAAMVLMALAVDAIIIPIILLADMNQGDKLVKAIESVTLLIIAMGLMAALMAAVGSIPNASGGMIEIAAGLLIFALAVDALAYAMQIMQQVDFEKIGGALAGLLLVLAGFVLIGAALGPLTLGVVALGAGVALLGVGCLAAAYAVYLISQSIDEFADMAPEKAAQAGEAMGAAFAGMLKGFGDIIGGWIGEMLTGLLGGALALAQGFVAVGMSIVNWIGNGINSFGGWLQEQAANLIGVDLMNGCEEQAKQVGENTGGALVGSMADKIKANKAKATGVVQETVTESTDAVADAAPQMEQAAQTGMVDPMTGAFDKFRQFLPAETQGAIDQWLPLLNVSDQTGAAMDLNMDSMYQSMANMDPELLGYAEQLGLDIPGMFKQPDLYGEAASANLEGEGGFLPMFSSILSERGLDISTASTEQIVEVLKDEPAFQEAGFVDADSFIDYLSNILPEGVDIADLTKEQILDLLRDPKNFEYAATQDEQASVKGFSPLPTHWGEITDRAKNFALSTLTKPSEFMASGGTNEKAYETGFQPIVTASGSIANAAGSTTIANLQNHDYAGTGGRIQNDVVSSASALIENLGNVASSGGRAFVSAIEATNAWGAGNALANSAKSGAESVSCYYTGAAIAAGFASGISDRAWEAVQEAQSMASRVKGIINGVMGIASPSKVTRKSGQFVAEGFALGIRDNEYMVAQSAEDLANVVPDTLGTGLESLRDSLSAIVDENLDTDPVIRPVLDLTDVNNNAQLLSGLLSGGNQAYTLAGIIQNQDPYGLSSLGSIDTTNRDLVDKIELLRADLQAYTEAAANSAVVMDTGALVGQLTPGIDMAMGQRQVMASRGVF